jgi:hypothetical protein
MIYTVHLFYAKHTSKISIQIHHSFILKDNLHDCGLTDIPIHEDVTERPVAAPPAATQ